MKSDIVFLTETWLQEWETDVFNEIKELGYTAKLYNSNTNIQSNVRKGLAWIVKNNLLDRIRVEFQNDRISSILLNQGDESIKIIGVYLTCMGTPTSSIEFQQDLMQLEITIQKYNQLTLIVGDYNSDNTRMIHSENNLTRYKYKYEHDRLLNEFIKRANLTLLDKLFTQILPNTYKKHESAIDHIAICNHEKFNKPISVNIVMETDEIQEFQRIANSSMHTEQIINIWHENNLSDHRPLSIVLEKLLKTITEPNDKTAKNENKKRNSVKYHVREMKITRKINWNNDQQKTKYHHLLQNKLKEALLKLNGNQNDPNEIIYHTILSAMHDTAEAKTVTFYTKSNEWWDNEMAQLWLQKKKWYDMHKESQSTFTETKYVYFKKLFEIKQKEKIMLKRNQIINTANMTYNNDINVFWSNLKHYFKHDVKLCVPIRDLKDNYMSLFNEKIVKNDNSDKETAVRSENEKYSTWCYEQPPHKVCTNIIKDIINSLANNKQPGHRGVPNEALKYGACDELLILLERFLDAFINSKYIPNRFNVGKIVPIIKDIKGNTNSAENARPLTISDALDNLIELYSLKIIESDYKLSKYQYGFRKLFSCAHAVYVMKETVIYYISLGKTIYALAIDFSKAFDKINRIFLFHILKNKVHTNPRIWLALYKYYNATKAFVQTDDEYSETFNTSTGVKQGGPISPLLFAIYVDEMLIEISKIPGICRIGDEITGVLAYADDTMILAENVEAMNNAIKVVENYCQEFEIKINEAKSQLIVFGNKKKTRANENEIKINNKVIEKVDQIKYLGVHISNDLSSKVHVENRKDKFRRSLYGLKGMGINDSKLYTTVKGYLIKTYALPVLSYGLECTQLSYTQIKSITTYMSTITKKVLQVNPRSHTTELMYALKIEPLDRFIIRRKIGFALALLNNEVTSKILNNMSNHLKSLNCNKSLTKEYFMLIQDESYNYDMMADKLNKLKRTIEKDNNSNVENDLVIEIRWLLNNPTAENWLKLHEIIMPKALQTLNEQDKES